MPEELTVGVTLTRDDMKRLYFATNRKPIIISGAFFILVYFALMAYLASTAVFYEDLLFILLLTVSGIVFYTGIMALMIYIRYKRFVGELNNKNFEYNIVYTFSYDGFVMDSEHGHMSSAWTDLAGVREYQTMFVLIRSPGKFGIVPKRCFAGPWELDRFVGVVTAAVDKKKLRLKNYPFTAFAPVRPEFLRTKPGAPAIAPEENPEAPILSVRTLLTKRDMLRYQFYLYYTRPYGIITTVLGAAVLLYIIFRFSDYPEPDAVLSFVIILCGILLLLGMPALILIQASGIAKKDPAINNTITYSFYKYRITVHTDKGNNARNIGDFRKLKELHWAYLLFLSARIAFVIPKRCVDEPAVFNAFFSYMQTENQRLKSAAMSSAAPFFRFCTQCGTQRPSAEYKFCPSCGAAFRNE